MSNYNTILLETSEKIAVITLNRPEKLNALNQKLLSELKQVFENLADNAEVNAVIITGAGEKAFAAGADIAEFVGKTPEQGRELANIGHELFNTIEWFPKPVIAAVNGFALGGGCELAMACHMRIAAENVKFGQPELNLGLIPGYGGTQRLTRYIGKAKATELLLTCDMINAQSALELGLVNYVVPIDDLISKAKEILSKIINKSMLNVTQILSLVNDYYDKEVDSFESEVEEFGECFGTEDFVEGVDAFLNKRKPQFKNK